MNRRQFVRRSAAVLAVTPIAGAVYASRVEPTWIDFVSRPLPVAGLPRHLEGASLVQVSDLHAGTVDEGFAAAALARAAALRPDYVVFTGDFVTARVPDAVDVLDRLLESFPLGTRGTAAIMGNHDYGKRGSTDDRTADVTSAATSRGLTVLRNEAENFDGLQIVGMDDLWSGAFDPVAAFAGSDPTAATVVLSHNPDTVDLPGWEGYRGWVLAGHTHGGQVRPPLFAPPVLPVQNRRYTSGEFALTEGRRMYISRGLGWVLKVRFNVRPEITVFRLETA